MIVRTFKAFTPVYRLVPAAPAILVAFAAACSDDDPVGPGPQLAKFCSDLFASPAFACCSEADRQDRQFSVRYGYGTSAAECADVFNRQAAEAQGRAVFNDAAAASCLGHLSQRACGAPPSAALRASEDEAGCRSLLIGTQGEGQSCATSTDCGSGLVCPPPKATGGSLCVKPASINQVCTGPATSVDHPPCVKGLICAFFQENPECAQPPCPEYRCVPFARSGEPCEATECDKGLFCRESTCEDSAGGEGASCKLSEHCAAGLYCEGASGQCTPQKATGEGCDPSANGGFECRGVCRQDADGSARCAPFCGSG